MTASRSRIGDHLLAVGQFLETCKGFVEFNFIERMSHLGQAGAQGMAAGMFAQHQLGLVDAHILRAHDLIGGLVLQHPILVDAGFMRKGIGADNRLVRLDDDARVIADQFADAAKSAVVSIPVSRPKIGLRVFKRHHHFFQRSIARPLADPVDGHLRLPRTGTNSRQRIGSCHAQVIVAVDRDRDAFMHAGRILDDAIDQCKILIRRGVAHRIGNIQRGCA